jgi:transcriptional regulator with XRE-family HTH domain
LLGRNIAHFRLEASLTQEQLAERTDYSVDFIGLVERGINAPTVERLKDIADVIGVEVWQLFHPNRGLENQAKSKVKKLPRKSESSKHGSAK